MTRRILRLTVCCTVLVMIPLSFPVSAGDVNLSWDTSANASGYRVHRGTVSGNYSSSSDEGNTTSTTIPGLADCTTWYFAVTAYNTAGESGYSAEVSSFPRALLSTAAPSTVEQDTQTSITVSGLNFRSGDTVALSNPGVQIDSVSVSSCNVMILTVTADADAPVGAVDVTVTHPSGVAATAAGLLTVEDGNTMEVPAPPTGIVVD